MNPQAVAALRDCRLDLLRAAVSAAHTQLALSGTRTVEVRELVSKVDDALAHVERLLTEAGEA